jgi:hypothetical protein
MTEGPGSNGVPRTFSDEELDHMGLRDPGVLAWWDEHLPQLRRSVYGQRILYQSLTVGFVVGLAAQISGYLLTPVATDGAACTGGRPALCARLGTMDRRRRDRIRPGRSGGQTAANQADAGCLRGNATREGPSRRRPGIGGRRSAAGEVAARLNSLRLFRLREGVDDIHSN